MSISDEIEDLFKDNYDALCMFSMHYVGDIYTAEDVVMDSFLKISEKIKDGEEIIAKKHYLYQIVRNESIDVAHYKRALKQRLMILPSIRKISTTGPS